MNPLLSVTSLQVSTSGQNLVSDISFRVQPGEFLAIVGESGSGKSVTAMACCGLLPPELSARGSARFDGLELLTLSKSGWRALRHNGIAAIFQDPMSSLNPLMRISVQISEAIDGTTRLDASRLETIGELLREVGLEPDERILHAFPFELSGGQQQRVMIAMALATNPRLLVADEPTTALDASTQAQVIELLQALRHHRNMAVLMVTHDLAIVQSAADRMAVFHAGQCVEQGICKQVMSNPKHPYTRSLVKASLENVRRKPERQQSTEAIDLNMFHDAGTPILVARDLSFRYPNASHDALRQINLSVKPSECLGIVGASGSGKSTLAKVLVGALSEISGSVSVCGLAPNLRWQSNPGNLAFARHCQYVFQDTTASLNPAHSIESTLIDAIRLSGHEGTRKDLRIMAARLLDEVGLSHEMLNRLPLQLSGGQRQRIVIARALAMKPDVLVCDEPVSALDAHLQKQVVNLLVDLQARHRMALVFIGHDLHLMSQFCDRLVVMDRGSVVESGLTQDLFSRPGSMALRDLLRHPDSKAQIEHEHAPDTGSPLPARSHLPGPRHGGRPSSAGSLVSAYLRSNQEAQTEAA